MEPKWVDADSLLNCLVCIGLRLIESSPIVTRKTNPHCSSVCTFEIDTMWFTSKVIRCTRISSSEVSDRNPPIYTSCFAGVDVLSLPGKTSTLVLAAPYSCVSNTVRSSWWTLLYMLVGRRHINWNHITCRACWIVLSFCCVILLEVRLYISTLQCWSLMWIRKVQ